jgi:predicted Zn-dependent peptidase
MDLSRRHALKGLLAGGAVICRQTSSIAHACTRPRSVVLDNGFRAHIVENGSRYIAGALLLRSSEIRTADGLAHILEHTSFAGAAGEYAASQIKQMHQDYIQDSNAFTEPGRIGWHVSFLPKYLEQVIGLLAVVSLDQKFDVETVRQEARVVLQELHLDRYDTKVGNRSVLGAALFGRHHPYGIDTTQSEIAKAKTPPDTLAAELRAYAQTVRLPANMDLFLAGGMDAGIVAKIVSKCFGGFPTAQGSMLALPQAPITRSYRVIARAAASLVQDQDRVEHRDRRQPPGCSGSARAQRVLERHALS